MSEKLTFAPDDVKKCNRLIRAKARNWDSGLELCASGGSRQAYESAAKHLHRLVMPHLPTAIQDRGVSLESGLSVAACFTHIAACIAVQHSLDQEELVNLARGRLSHQVLQLPASTKNNVAISIEDLTGLRPTNWHVTATKTAQYHVGADGFELADQRKTIDTAIYYGNNDIEDSDSLPAGNCPAGKLGMIYPLLEAMVTIADNDPRLFAATLARGTIE